MIVYTTLRKHYTRTQILIIDVFIVILKFAMSFLNNKTTNNSTNNLIQYSCTHVCSQFVLVLISFYRKYKTPRKL